MKFFLLFLVVFVGLRVSPASAQSHRYALLVGENRGEGDELRLRYAQSDAKKLRDVLVDLGGFLPENVTLLSKGSASSMRRALISLNERIRADSGQSMLFVYYSGHADANALHLDGSNLAISELEALVRGSSADVRLLVLDSCRSGALTRVKGGRRTAPFAIQINRNLASSGAVFLTSSSANEDAQESDSLKGSFFTHYLVSGLLGSADVNRDGKVVLSEAYRYAYGNTLRASSRTMAGTQHPTFRYDLSGKGDIVLTRPGSAQASRGWLSFAKGRSYLLLEGNSAGGVVAEVGKRDRVRKISIREGAYFVRARGRDYLLEGHVQVRRGQTLAVEDNALTRTEYARLVRKGGGALRRVHGPIAGASGHSALANSSGICAGAYIGYGAEFSRFDTSFRLRGCQSSFANEHLQAKVSEFEAQVRLGHAFDLPFLTVAPYLGVGAGLFSQRFTTLGRAPSRLSFLVHVDVGMEFRRMLYGPVFFSVDAAIETYGFKQGERGDFGTSVGVRLSTGAGISF